MPYAYKLKSEAIQTKYLLEAGTGDRYTWWQENGDFIVERASTVGSDSGEVSREPPYLCGVALPRTKRETSKLS